MDKAVLEQEAKKLFGGATIDVQPFNDGIRKAWDVTIVPYIDKGARFIRLSEAGGMAAASVYLKKIQQNLLQLNKNGAFGINPVAEKVDGAAVEEEIAKRMPKNKDTFVCLECTKTFKHAGIFAIHKKKHVKRPESIAKAPNESMIYNA